MSEDSEKAWDGNAHLCLKLHSIDSGSSVHHRVFKNADLDMLDRCYKTYVSCHTVDEASQEDCDASEAKLMLQIPVEYQEGCRYHKY